ncbi:MAG TPA: hypothetical protein VFZ67_08675 [Nitrososphaera sp.]|jgi:hypothetical protein
MLKMFLAMAKLAKQYAVIIVKRYGVQMQCMSQQNSSAYSEEHSRERLQMMDTLKAPIIQMGRELGCEVVENHDLGAGPVHVAWVFKPGSESLPDMRLGFICLTEFSNSSINEGIARAMLNLVDKLVFIVPSEAMTGEVKNAIESMQDKGKGQQEKTYRQDIHGTDTELSKGAESERERSTKRPGTGA